ncbi:hypothetical protein [Streptomyces sp. NPDC057889]|uniref:hypothetical protein n=1 Tax=unclassified Streptomyces TaxID=2593676 RepID=UPI0036CDE695
MIAMIRSGALADGFPALGEHAPSAPVPAAPAIPAASLPKERRLRSRLLVDIVVLVFLLWNVLEVLTTCPVWSNW